MKDGSGITCICNGCGKSFELTVDGEPIPDECGIPQKTASLDFSQCESAGVYGASVTCPKCGHEHELY